MAKPSWKTFHQQIRDYFFGEKKPEAKQKPKTSTFFLVKNFCGYSEDPVVIAQQEIYAMEGAVAKRHADIVEKAITDLRKQIQPAVNGVSSLRNDRMRIKQAANNILSTHETMRNSKFAREPLIAYLQARVLLPPADGTQIQPFISKNTSYYSKTSALNARRPTPVPFPTFWNMVGINIFHPFCWLDALGDIFCHWVGKNICKGLNYLAGKHKNSWGMYIVKGLLAGPFILGKIITFTLAKLTTPSGWRELSSQNADLVAPSLQRVAAIVAPEETLAIPAIPCEMLLATPRRHLSREIQPVTADTGAILSALHSPGTSSPEKYLSPATSVLPDAGEEKVVNIPGCVPGDVPVAIVIPPPAAADAGFVLELVQSAQATSLSEPLSSPALR